MLLAVALAVLTVAVLATVVLPLMKGARPAPERGQFDRAVYRDQLQELERDVARGLIAPGEAATARLEIERRLLATDAPAETAPARGAGSPVLAIALTLIVPAAASLLYLALGAPGVPDQPYAQRAAERSRIAATGPDAMAKAIVTLKQRLNANPDSAADWLLLARSEAALAHWPESTQAFQQAMRLTKDSPDVAADYGETLVMAAQGIVTPQARAMLGKALAGDPGSKAARYYLALGEAQAGNAAAAIAGWQALAGDEPAESAVRAELKKRIEDAARTAGIPVPALAPPAAGPSQAQIADAATMTPGERQQMIRGMVDGLAAKLAADPGDVEGWMKLGRAYGVLGERDKAVDAYERAERLQPDDARILLAEAELLVPRGLPQTPLPERMVTLLRHVDALDARQPAALWYLGLASVQQRDFAAARGYWRRLLEVLPADADQHQAVAAALDALKDK
jgi:cytochrome c-type biogenesis protein CcmH